MIKAQKNIISTTSNRSSDPLYQTLAWGIMSEYTESPHSKRVLSYCIIDSNFYATTDGHNIAFWKPQMIIKTFSLPATALFYFSKISNVVAYVRGSHQLHFISINHPFQIRVHPLHFSESKIYSFFYFKTTSTLVSAGDGILFTRVSIPPYFKDTQPMPETLQFEKISLHYEGISFKGLNNPRFIENSNFGIVLLYINDTIHIHTSNGTEVQVISNLFINDHISSLSLLSFSNSYSNINSNSLVIGTNSGNVTILKFELPEPFVPNAPSESCKNVETYKISNSKILLSELFDREFIVSVDCDRLITIFGIQNESIIQEFKCSIEAIGGFFAFDKLILFSQFMISIYQCSFFLNHFSDVGSNSVDIFRAVSETRSARIICFQENSCVSFFSPKDGKQIFGFTTGSGCPTIRNICYTRDVEIDGLHVSKRMSEDLLFCHLDQGITSILQLDEIDRTNYTNRNELFRSTISNFNMSWIPTPYLEDHDLMNQFVAFLDIGHEKVCGVVETGNVYIFSSQMKIESTFSLNEKDIICSIYSFTNELLIISAMKKLFTFDLKTRKITSSSDDCVITSLLLLDNYTLFCGCANGFIEIRSFPSLMVKMNSSLYNTCHTENGHRTPLQDTYLSTRQLYLNPSAVKKLDFCARRETVLSLSSYGEIFLWDKTGKPLTRISIPFGVKSACFADGTGSILISSMKNLFKIEWDVLFKKQLLPIQTPLDDFDLRIDSFDIKILNNREPPVILTVADEEKFIFFENENEEDEIESEVPFQDLKVELNPIPKRFFAPLRDDEKEEQATKTNFPLQDIDEIIENERKLEAERNKKKKGPKKIKVKSRRGDSKKAPLYESRSKASSNRVSNKYADYYEDDEPKSSRRYKKKVKKISREAPKKYQTSLSLNSKSSNYDRFNSAKNVRKKNPRFAQTEFSKSLQQLPTIKDSSDLKFPPNLTKSFTSDNESFNTKKDSDSFKQKIEKKVKSEIVKKSEVPKKSEVVKKIQKKKNKKEIKKKAIIKPKKEEEEKSEEEEEEEEVEIIFEPNPEVYKKSEVEEKQCEAEIESEKEPEVVINISNSIFEQQNENEEEVSDNSIVYQVHEPGEMIIREPTNEISNEFYEPINQPSIRQKIQATKSKSQAFITQPNEVSVEKEEEEESIHKESSSKMSTLSDHSRKSEPKPPIIIEDNEQKEKRKKVSKYSRITRKRAIDDEMFSNFRIDGFDFPFGGYALKPGRGVVSIADNAPLLMVSNTISNNDKQKKQRNGKSIYVKRVSKP